MRNENNSSFLHSTDYYGLKNTRCIFKYCTVHAFNVCTKFVPNIRRIRDCLSSSVIVPSIIKARCYPDVRITENKCTSN